MWSVFLREVARLRPPSGSVFSLSVPFARKRNCFLRFVSSVRCARDICKFPSLPFPCLWALVELVFSHAFPALQALPTTCRGPEELSVSEGLFFLLRLLRRFPFFGFFFLSFESQASFFFLQSCPCITFGFGLLPKKSGFTLFRRFCRALPLSVSLFLFPSPFFIPRLRLPTSFCPLFVSPGSFGIFLPLSGFFLYFRIRLPKIAPFCLFAKVTEGPATSTDYLFFSGIRLSDVRPACISLFLPWSC